MRTYGSAFEAKLAESTTAPIQLVVFGDTIFASDRDITIDGNAFEGLVEDWGSLLTNETGVSYTTLTLINTNNNFFERLGVDIVESVEVKLYQTFEGLSYVDKELIDVFVIRDPIERSEASNLIRLDIVSLHDRYKSVIGTLLSREDWPLLPDSLINKTLPVVTGNATVEAQLLTEAPVTYVMGSHLAGATILYVESTEEFNDAGNLQVEDAIISYTSKTSASFNGVTGLTQDVLDSVEVAQSLSNIQYGIISGTLASVSSISGDGVVIAESPSRSYEHGITLLNSPKKLTIETFDVSSKFVTIHPDTVMGSNSFEQDTNYDTTEFNSEPGETTASNPGFAYDDENKYYAAIMRHADKLQVIRRGTIESRGDVIRAYFRAEVFLVGKVERALITAHVGDKLLGALSLYDKGGSTTADATLDYSHTHDHDVTHEHSHSVSVSMTDPGHIHATETTQNIKLHCVRAEARPYTPGLNDMQDSTYYTMTATGSAPLVLGGFEHLRPVDASNVAYQRGYTDYLGTSYSAMTVAEYASNPIVKSSKVVGILRANDNKVLGPYAINAFEASLTIGNARGSVYIRNIGSQYFTVTAGHVTGDTDGNFALESTPESTNTPIHTYAADHGTRIQYAGVEVLISGVWVPFNALEVKLDISEILFLVECEYPVSTNINKNTTGIQVGGAGAEATDGTGVDLHDLNAFEELSIDVEETTNTAVTNFDITDIMNDWSGAKDTPITLTYTNPEVDGGLALVLNTGFEFEYKQRITKIPSKIEIECVGLPETPTQLRRRILSLGGVPAGSIKVMDTPGPELDGVLDGDLSIRDAEIVIERHSYDTFSWVAGEAVTLIDNPVAAQDDLTAEDVLAKSMKVSRRLMSDVVPVQRCTFTGGNEDVTSPAVVTAIGDAVTEVKYPLFNANRFNSRLKGRIVNGNVPTDIVECSLFLQAMRYQIGDVVTLTHQFFPAKQNIQIQGLERVFGSGKLGRINMVNMKGMRIVDGIIIMNDSEITFAENAPNGFSVAEFVIQTLSDGPFVYTIIGGNNGAFGISGTSLVLQDTSLIDHSDPDYALRIQVTGGVTGFSEGLYTVHISSITKTPASFFKLAGNTFTWDRAVEPADSDGWDLRYNDIKDWGTSTSVVLYHYAHAYVAPSIIRGKVYMLRGRDTVGNMTVTRYVVTGLGDAPVSQHTFEYSHVDHDFPGVITGGERGDGYIRALDEGVMMGADTGLFMGANDGMFFTPNYMEFTYGFDVTIQPEYAGSELNVDVVSDRPIQLQWFNGSSWQSFTGVSSAAATTYQLRVYAPSTTNADVVPTVTDIIVKHTVNVESLDKFNQDVSIDGEDLVTGFSHTIAVDVTLNDTGTGAVEVERTGNHLTLHNDIGTPVSGSVSVTIYGVTNYTTIP